MTHLIDKYGREHNYLRLSITDKCNLNCSYCNPQKNKTWGSNKEILSYEEILRIVKIFLSVFGFKKIRLTGGEPFVRKDIELLIQSLAILKAENAFELCATTNGVNIKSRLQRFKDLGLDRLNFSLDSLHKESYASISGKDALDDVLASIDEAINIGFNPIKINVVALRSINGSEIFDFVDFAIHRNLCIRFIEYMPFSNNGYDKNLLLPISEIKSMISEKYCLEPATDIKSVSTNYNINKGQAQVGFISSMTNHFCKDCSRLRLSSNGILKLCLFSKNDDDLNLLDLIRQDYRDEEIAERIRLLVLNKRKNRDEMDEIIKLKNNKMISIGG